MIVFAVGMEVGALVGVNGTRVGEPRCGDRVGAVVRAGPGVIVGNGVAVATAAGGCGLGVAGAPVVGVAFGRAGVGMAVALGVAVLR